MKKIFNIRLAAVASALTLVMLTNNCTNLTDGYSTDPVNITDPKVIAVSKYIAGVEVSLMGVFEGEFARVAGMWSGYFSGDDRQYVGLGQYSCSGQDFDNTWGAIYSGVLENTKLIRKNAYPANNFVSVGMAQVMDAMVLGLAADMWGDVPYTEAVKFPDITAPAFDTQASVYSTAQLILDSALVNLTKSGTTSGDFLLGGSKTNWAKVAHTVKARLYLHTKNYTNAITEASLGISSTSGNLMAQHGDAYLQTFNLYYSFTTYDRPAYMNANSYAPLLLDASSGISRNNAKTDESARLNYIYYPGGGLNSGADYELNVLVDFDWGVPTEYNGFFGATTSFPIVTWEENMLILAEAYAKTADPTNALISLNNLRAYYNTGAHVNSGYANDYGYFYAPYVYSDFAPGDIENLDDIAQDKALLREILEERYVTLIGQIEGWNDMRRTGNFLNIPLPAGKTNYPRRALYSQIEVNTNPNVPTTGVGLFDNVNSFSTAY